MFTKIEDKKGKQITKKIASAQPKKFGFISERGARFLLGRIEDNDVVMLSIAN